ncbi:MAG: FecCD family ABC transporter permease, partial [Pseudoclavibacter sp.]
MQTSPNTPGDATGRATTARSAALSGASGPGAPGAAAPGARVLRRPGAAALSEASAGLRGLPAPDAPVAPSAYGARRIFAFVVGLVLLFAMLCLSLAVGAQSISPATVFESRGANPPPNDPPRGHATHPLARPSARRAAGAAGGGAGAVMQALTRNDLADPGLLGVNGGASLAVVLTIAFLGITNPIALVWFAMIGAAAALGIVLLISVLRSDRSSDAVVPIAGMSITTLCTAGVSIIMVSDRATLSTFRHWQVGSLAGRDLETVWQLAIVLAIGFLLAIVAGPLLDLLSLGDELARGLGANLGLSRAISLGAIVLLCGAAVS